MTSSNKKWISGILVLMLFAVAVFLLMGWRMQAITTAMSQQITSPLYGTSVYQKLQLTDDQKNQIQALEKEYQKKISVYCGRHCSARLKIGQLLQAGQTDEKSLLPFAKEVGDAYAECENLTLQHVSQICSLLNPQQKAAFLKEVSDHIAATCPKQFMQ